MPRRRGRWEGGCPDGSVFLSRSSGRFVDGSLGSICLVRKSSRCRIRLTIGEVLTRLLRAPGSRLGGGSRLQAPDSRLVSNHIRAINSALHLLHDVHSTLLTSSLFDKNKSGIICIHSPSFLAVSEITESRSIGDKITALARRVGSNLPRKAALIMSAIHIGHTATFCGTYITGNGIASANANLGTETGGRTTTVLVGSVLPGLKLGVDSALRHSFLSHINDRSEHVTSRLRGLTYCYNSGGAIARSSVGTVASSNTISRV